MFIKRYAGILLFVLLFQLLLPVAHAWSFENAEVRVTQILLLQKEKQLWGSATLQVDLDEIKTSLLSGIGTTISYVFSLVRVRSSWFDSTVTTLRIDCRVSYDLIKKQFQVQINYNGQQQEMVHFENFAAVARKITVMDVVLSGDTALLPSGKYNLLVDARMSALHDDSLLRSILFFYSFDTFQTDQVSSLALILSPRGK